MKSVSLAVFALFLATAAHGSERIFIGQVSEILMVPEGHQICPPICPDPPREIDGLVQFCISNSCGCGEAKVRVMESLTASPKGREATVRYRLGEWCMAGFPLTGETILIWEVPGHVPAWGPVTNPGTRRALFDLEDFEHLESVVLQRISADRGKVRVSELRRALRH